MFQPTDAALEGQRDQELQGKRQEQIPHPVVALLVERAPHDPTACQSPSRRAALVSHAGVGLEESPSPTPATTSRRAVLP